MAEIRLHPKEQFEHTHEDQSLTILRAGTATLEFGGTVHELKTDVPVSVPANVAHILTNVGTGVAHVDCVHEGAPGDLKTD